MPEIHQPQAKGFDAVAAISNILQAEKPPVEEKKKPETPPEQVEAQPEAQPNAQVEGAEAKADERPALEISEEDLETIEIEVKEWTKDGKRIPVKRTIKELREGSMRLDDYSRNIQDVARQRDELPAKIREGIEGERKVYQDNLRQLHDLVLETAASELKGVDWNNLAANDPALYVQKRNRADQLNNALVNIKNKYAELDTKTKTEASEAQKRAARELHTKLESEISGYNQDLYQKVVKTAETFGYDPKEVSEWVDPRAIKLLHAVYEYQQLKPGKPQEKKVVLVPKSVTPGAAQPQNTASRKAEEAMKRLQSSGKVEDAAAVIASRMG